MKVMAAGFLDGFYITKFFWRFDQKNREKSQFLILLTTVQPKHHNEWQYHLDLQKASNLKPFWTRKKWRDSRHQQSDRRV